VLVLIMLVATTGMIMCAHRFSAADRPRDAARS
jgi:hypothetical protein